ncbi:MAG: hypothetical protein ACREMG_12460, partial [Gemmatimonadales bacterium]
VLVNRALDYLQAKLPSPQWQLLWRRAAGYSLPDLVGEHGETRRVVKRNLELARKKAGAILSRQGIVSLDG